MNSLFDVSGKVAVVTGGSGVLGSNISEGLLKAGAKVAVIGAHSDRVEKALERLRKTGGEVCGFTCNVLDMDSLREVKEKVLAQWGRVDILVNAAGGNIPGGTLTETQHVFDMKVEDLNKVVDLNLNGTVYPCLVFGEVMAAQKSGSIINVSSMASYEAITRVPGYSMAKSAVENFTRWMAQEMALKFSEKIRVNAIAPGFIQTPWHENRTPESYERINRKIALHRFGEIKDVADMAYSILTNNYMNGSIVDIHGGYDYF